MPKKTISPESLPVISRDDAIKLGLTRYFLGPEFPCKNGHVCERYSRNTICVDCSLAAIKEWAKDNPEREMERRRRETQKPRTSENKKTRRLARSEEEIERNKQRSKEWHALNKERVNRESRERYTKNKEIYQKYQLEYRTSNQEKILVRQAKIRAKKYGVPFDLEPEDISVPEFCPVLGIPLEKGPRGFYDNSATIDRFIPELGYVKGNVAVISFRANRIKYNTTLDEIQKVLDWMKSKVNPT